MCPFHDGVVASEALHLAEFGGASWICDDRCCDRGTDPLCCISKWEFDCRGWDHHHSHSDLYGHDVWN